MKTRPHLHNELLYQHIYEENNKKKSKDIIIVVHDQLSFLEKCIESIYKNTENFTLYIWDNDSMPPTREYLEDLERNKDNIVLLQNSENIGFIIPNNELVKLGNSDYIILLNSDTEVAKGWDTAMIGWLENNPNCGIVGYQGSTLQEDGSGSGNYCSGSNIDYICGWCLCLSREKVYNKIGLFDDKNLIFAYGEDSDFSLKIKEIGMDIYSLHIQLVTHYGNKTSFEVMKERDTSFSFQNNHKFIRSRWDNYLKYDRQELKIHTGENQET